REARDDAVRAGPVAPDGPQALAHAEDREGHRRPPLPEHEGARAVERRPAAALDRRPSDGQPPCADHRALGRSAAALSAAILDVSSDGRSQGQAVRRDSTNGGADTRGLSHPEGWRYGAGLLPTARPPRLCVRRRPAHHHPLSDRELRMRFRRANLSLESRCQPGKFDPGPYRTPGPPRASPCFSRISRRLRSVSRSRAAKTCMSNVR
ncbi:MAG: hypothetical protein QOI98_3587, partial [Solirubrobacteraceae bacterium]|nr:hypothetical protein [Solirubrobacteraceae bacterium]